MGAPGREQTEAWDLEAELDGVPLTDGQIRRIRLLASVDAEVCDRIGQVCVDSAVDVTDVAVVVVAPGARRFVFDTSDTGDDRSTTSESSIVAGTRQDIYAFLLAVLPPTQDSAGDPYADLLEPAPPGCARAIVADETSLTILSYGSFVVVKLDADGTPQA